MYASLAKHATFCPLKFSSPTSTDFGESAKQFRPRNILKLFCQGLIVEKPCRLNTWWPQKHIQGCLISSLHDGERFNSLTRTFPRFVQHWPFSAGNFLTWQFLLPNGHLFDLPTSNRHLPWPLAVVTSYSWRTNRGKPAQSIDTQQA